MDVFTFLISFILFCLIALIALSFFSLVNRAKNQTRDAFQELEEQIKHKLIEKIIFIGATQSKNLYKYGKIVIKSIARLIKEIPFKVEILKQKNNKKSKNNKK